MAGSQTKHFILPFIFIVFFSTQISITFGQQKVLTGDHGLKLTWQPRDNNYEGKRQSLSVLSITNTSSEPMPKSGWKIYFNGWDTYLTPENHGLKFSYINGDLYQLEPTPALNELPPGVSMDYFMIKSGKISNISRAPRGFYLVWDNDPKQAFPLNYALLDPDADFLKKEQASATSLMNPPSVFDKNSAIKDIPADELPKIFPSPAEYKSNGTEFILGTETKIFADVTFKNEAFYLSSELAKVLNAKPVITAQLPAKGAIVLKKVSGMGKEAYTLQVSANQITISATYSAGAFYGIQSLKSLLPPLSWKTKQQNIKVPGVDVKDEPRFGYRSFLLDIARNFQPKDEVIRILDLMSLYKLNAFHLHFSDDEGWRVEIPSLPELTSVGGSRGQTTDNKENLQPSYGSGGLTGKLPGSGFYSKKDFIDILKYAAARHISVIPEIESPGHARAAIKSMENRYAKFMKQGNPADANKYLLSEFKDASKYRSVQGWADNVMNVTLPSTYAFMEKVTDELIAMYKEARAPLTTVHFGGDEVPNGVWAQSPAYLKLKDGNPAIQNTNDMWYYYFGKLNAMAKKKGLFVSGWEEAGMRKTMLDGRSFYIANPDFADDNFQLNVWNNTIGEGYEDLAYRLANAGYKVVLSPVSNQYFDLAYNNSYFEPGLSWGGYVDVDKPFYFIPYDFLKNVKEDARGNPVSNLNTAGKIRLTDYGKSNIVGLQGLLWSENNINVGRVEYMMLPKLLGLAERAWAKDPDWAAEKDMEKSNASYAKAWDIFTNTLGKRELPRLSYYNSGYAYRIPEPGLKADGGMVRANIQIPGLEIRYTTDGSEPTASSSLYSQPVGTRTVIKAAAFDAGGRKGRTAELDNK
ncbi:MAG TPA: beta-N-acetylhexosaminidase [Sphingobacteriaceae bacterium]|nr:beta-N-acetylhexosaminidase [Sphingobacteriaceae bacterium]